MSGTHSNDPTATTTAHSWARRCVWHLLIGIAYCGLFFPLVLPLAAIDDQPISQTAWILVWLSTAANLAVLTYHYVAPPHPKFAFVGWRRRVLAVHLLAGTCELAAGLVACFLGGHATAGTAMAIIALTLHIPTAALMTPTVFGARVVTWPSYSILIAMHAFSAVLLLFHADSLYWTVTTFLILNVYVWVRVYYYAFDVSKLFAESPSTAAILFAGMTILPVIVGPLGPFVVMAACLLHYALHRVLFGREQSRSLTREHHFEGHHLPSVSSLWAAILRERELSPEKVFEKLGAVNGQIQASNLHAILSTFPVPRETIEDFIAHAADQDGTVSFESFHRLFWSIHEFREMARQHVFSATEHSAIEKAAFVFRLLDLDGDGRLGPIELRALTSAWNLPAGESDVWLRIAGASAEDGIDDELFFRRMKPIWQFIYYDVVDARHGTQENLLQRAISDHRRGIQRIADRRVFSGQLEQSKELMYVDLQSSLSELGFDHESLIAGILARLVDELVAASVRVNLSDGEKLIAMGETARTVWLVHTGYVVLRWRGEVEMIFGPNDWLVIEDDELSHVEAVARGRVILFRIASDVFQRIREAHPELRRLYEPVDLTRKNQQRTLAQ